jgi:hypothetical protein
VDPGTLRTTSASTGVPLIIKVGGNYRQAAGGTLAIGIGGAMAGSMTMCRLEAL